MDDIVEDSTKAVSKRGVFLYRLSTPWVGLFGGVNGFCFVS